MIFVYIGGGRSGLFLSAILFAFSLGLPSWLWDISSTARLPDPLGALFKASRDLPEDEASYPYGLLLGFLEVFGIVSGAVTLFFYREVRTLGICVFQFRLGFVRGNCQSPKIVICRSLQIAGTSWCHTSVGSGEKVLRRQ